MSKIVFFDIDGTLLNQEKNLPVSTKEAIFELKKRGIYVAIATGRAPFMFEELREELEIESFVSFNGQYVVYENEVIYQQALNQLELEKLAKQSEINGHPLVFMNEKTMKASVPHHNYIEECLAGLGFPHPVEEREFFRGKRILQTLIFCEEQEEKFYSQQYQDFKFIRWHQFSADILPGAGSKAIGIQKLIERLGFKLDDVYAFGDGLNDIEMIQTVGTGVAMGNAVDSLKKYADHVTADVSNEGIWKGLKTLDLI
ncbi:Cof-type HAD-IIB family hydrolase [Bacillus sp. B15-48]|uniref:Cof-type HAD-IIB family hydrolase n=1 Tax=Bacillus sp. B15-48 TaxID=1548601 RepID=UPI00193FD4F4|nr:Cof-type HAD-IIB family hydrolase [Bacillus sp. B15-48]MBM4764351.1 Cof-type HAD-IIB family hydrolase [Bacillus sp. B15-48]